MLNEARNDRNPSVRFHAQAVNPHRLCRNSRGWAEGSGSNLSPLPAQSDVGSRNPAASIEPPRFEWPLRTGESPKPCDRHYRPFIPHPSWNPQIVGVRKLAEALLESFGENHQPRSQSENHEAPVRWPGFFCSSLTAGNSLRALRGRRASSLRRERNQEYPLRSVGRNQSGRPVSIVAPWRPHRVPRE